MRLNPFGTGQCLSTTKSSSIQCRRTCLNPFGTGQCLSTVRMQCMLRKLESSQSLWNRAMSFDQMLVSSRESMKVSIPLEQGNVFRHTSLKIRQGNVSLNPFGTGQCLSTINRIRNLFYRLVSIPLEQGNVFRLNPKVNYKDPVLSQSLWNRAMSFDAFV